MIEKIKNIPDGKELWLKVKRTKSWYDNDKSIRFTALGKAWDYIYLNDYNLIFTEEELKALANDGMPKQGDLIHVRDYEWYWDKRIFVSFYKWKVVAVNEFDSVNIWDEWRFPPKKTELTLAEVEEKLGLDAWSLIIK